MRAVCYARTSTFDQARDEKVSIPDQVTWAKTFALEKGWEWIGEYIEPGVTGDTEPEQRDSLSRLLQKAKDDAFDIVLVYHSSRLAREPDIGMKICRLLGQIRKQVYFRNCPIEPVSPDKFAWATNTGSHYMTAFSFIGDLQENVARSERVRSGFQGLAKRGKLVNAPYGYKKIVEIVLDAEGKKQYDWHFEEDLSKALIVKKVFKDYISEGGSIRKIMLILNQKRTPSPSGKISAEGWSATTIRNILTNPVYIGKVRWGRKLGGKYLQGKTSTGKQRRIFKPLDECIITDSEHPKLIEIDVFNKAQEKLKIRYVLRGRAVASKGLLVGLVLCGVCGKKAHFKNRHLVKKGKRYERADYVCPTYINYKSCKRHIMAAKKLHEVIISEIEKIASNPKYRDKFLNQDLNNNNSQLTTELEGLKKQKTKIEESQRRILMAFEEKFLSLEDFGKRKRELDTNLFDVIGQIDKIEKVFLNTSLAEISKKKILSLLNDFKSNFYKKDITKQKDLLQSLIKSIIIKENHVKINYRI